MQSKTPLVDSLGLNHLRVSILTKGRKSFIDIRDLSFDEATNPTGQLRTALFLDDLESVLEKLTVVYGNLDAPKDQIGWSDTKLASDTHTARLLGIQEITKEPFIHTEGWAANRSQEHVLIPFELKGKRLKVTFEEVK